MLGLTAVLHDSHKYLCQTDPCGNSWCETASYRLNELEAGREVLGVAAVLHHLQQGRKLLAPPKDSAVPNLLNLCQGRSVSVLPELHASSTSETAAGRTSKHIKTRQAVIHSRHTVPNRRWQVPPGSGRRQHMLTSALP